MVVDASPVVEVPVADQGRGPARHALAALCASEQLPTRGNQFLSKAQGGSVCLYWAKQLKHTHTPVARLHEGVRSGCNKFGLDGRLHDPVRQREFDV